MPMQVDKDGFGYWVTLATSGVQNDWTPIIKTNGGVGGANMVSGAAPFLKRMLLCCFP